MEAPITLSPQDVWQEIYPDSMTLGAHPDSTFATSLPDGRRLRLPIRVLPGGTDRGVASLILNQASFAVLDALADSLHAQLDPFGVEVVIGVPTLGLPLAEALARRLGHPRLVPLSTSRKFWYDDALSQPISSITTPDQAKKIFLDPRMLPLLEGRRILLVDDVLSSGTSITAVLRLLRAAGITPVVIAAAMLQGKKWQQKVEDEVPGLPVIGAIRTPILSRQNGTWLPEDKIEHK